MSNELFSEYDFGMLAEKTSNHLPELKPFIKWAGGKKQLLPEIRRVYPKGFGTEIKKYCEPFVGGGAVLFDVLSHFQLESVYISDINRELIWTYQTIRDNVDELISLLSFWSDEYRIIATAEEKIKEEFYRKRDEFNKLKVEESSDNVVRVAALFIYLNRTCFNGLYRVNRDNLFNVPAGKYKNPTICDEANLRNISKALQNVEIVCGSYKESVRYINKNTFVYFDPPYRPLNASSSFTSYTKFDFNDDDQKELAAFVKTLSYKGVLVAVSNSDPKNTSKEDNFFDDLYAGLNIRRISASRMINSKADGRGKINELLICNY